MLSLADKMKARIEARGSLVLTSLSSRLIETHGLDPHPNSRAAQALAVSGASRTSEFLRIYNLPRRELDFKQVPDLTARFLKNANKCTVKGCRVCADGVGLWSVQSAALADAQAQGGLFGALACGSGKTLISLLVGAAMNARRIVLLVPPEVRDQLITTDIPAAMRHYHVPIDRLHVVSYSQLSVASGAEILDQIKPDLIVADECHRLKRAQSTRTKRFARFMRENPDCRLVALSGTVTTRSLKDYSHIIELCLRKNSPLPKPYRELMTWADALDVIKPNEKREQLPPGILLKFCQKDEPVRSGFRRRLIETPGVVATSEGAIGTSLYLRAQRPVVPWSILDALETLGETWEIGDEELIDALAVARVAKQISCGFYYVWKWPGGVVDHEWLEARKIWHRAVREFLKHRARRGVDSPLLLSNAIARGEFPELLPEWSAWQAVKDRPEPPVEPVWISDFLVDYAFRWLNKQEDNGILWFEHRAIEEALRKKHVTVFGAGMDAELGATKEDRIACSIAAHGTGKNLQRWSRGLVLSHPSNGAKAEQMYSRMHRPGQEADEVHFDVCMHTEPLVAAFAAAVTDAHYVQETQGQKQKILYAQKIGF